MSILIKEEKEVIASDCIETQTFTNFGTFSWIWCNNRFLLLVFFFVNFLLWLHALRMKLAICQIFVYIVYVMMLSY